MRKQREIDPALRTLARCLDIAEADSRISDLQRRRLADMFEFTSNMDRWYGQMLNIPSSTLMKLVKLGDRVVALAGLGKKGKAKPA